MSKKAIFTFGRFQPPTIGHELLVKKLLSLSKKENATPYIFLSHTQDSKKNPLNWKDKVRFFELFFPYAKSAVNTNPDVRTPFDAIGFLVDEGYTDVIMLVGSDRVKEFQNSVKPYIDHPDPEKRIPLKSFVVKSVGERDPDSDDDVAAMSSSKVRNSAKQGDFSGFLAGIPKNIPLEKTKELYNIVRKNMNINIKENLYLGDTMDKPMTNAEISRKRWQSFKQWWMMDTTSGDLDETTGDEHDKGDYLVVDKDGNGHLPVKKRGKIDHRLMGAAWASLTGGYRGNKYEGPDKSKAMQKLRALYKREGMPLPE